MKIKSRYLKPCVEIIKMEMQEVVASSVGVGKGSHTGPAGSKKRDFWLDNE